jgi:hypothetical protein
MISISAIESDIKEALKSGDKTKLSTLRLLLSEARSIAKDKHAAELSEEDLIAVVKRQIKKRKEAAEHYLKANRTDLAEKETNEAKILNQYLPPQLSEDQIRKLVKETIDELGVASISEMGKAIGAVMGKVKGTADGQTVSRMVKEELVKKV